MVMLKGECAFMFTPKKHFWGFALLLGLLLGRAAMAAQLSDDFSNAAYDGSFDQAKWDAGASSLTLAQSAGKLTLSMPDMDWAASMLALRAKAGITGSYLTKATRFAVQLDSFQVTHEGNQVRGGLTVDQSLQLFFYDAQGYSDGMYPWGGAGFNISLYLANDTNQVAVEVSQKDPGNPNWIGNGIGYRTVAVTLPLQIEVLMNQNYYELRLNGQSVLAGIHHVATGLFNGQAGFEVIGANAGQGRGQIVLDQVTVDDIGQADLSGDPRWLVEDFTGTAFDVANLIPLGDTGGTVSLQNDALTLAPPAADWAVFGVETAKVFALPDGDTTTFSQTVICTAVTPSTGTMNLNLLAKEFPGGVNLAQAAAYYFQPQAGLVLVINSGADGGDAHMLVFSKPNGQGNSNGDLILSDTPLTLTLPAAVRLDVSATHYAVYVGGQRVASGAHTAAFTGRISGAVAASNQQVGRGSITVDDYRAGRLGLIGNVSRARHWGLYD
jgi:hypothetical protein